MNDNTHGTVVSHDGERFKLAQALYGIITGKTEKLIKGFSSEYRISMENFNQLNAKCHQVCTQWKTLQCNENVSVQYIDDASEQFSSFNRFMLLDKSRASPTESVVYEFNFLIQHHNLPAPQHYKVTVRSMSRPALLKRMDKSEIFNPAILRFFGSGTIVVEIEYVDYLVARSLLSTIDSWVNELEEIKGLKWSYTCRRYSHYVPTLFQVGVVVVATIALAATVSNAFDSKASLATLARWLIWAAVSLWVTGVIGKILGRFVEGSLDSIRPLGGLMLNVGDDKLKVEMEKQVKGGIVKSVLGALGGVAQAVVTKSFTGALLAWLSL